MGVEGCSLLWKKHLRCPLNITVSQKHNKENTNLGINKVLMFVDMDVL